MYIGQIAFFPSFSWEWGWGGGFLCRHRQRYWSRVQMWNE